MALEYAFRLSLISFVTKLLLGVIRQSHWDATLTSAIVTSLLFFGIGFALGEICRRLVQESVLGQLTDASENRLQS